MTEEDKKKKLKNTDGNLSFTLDAFKTKQEIEDEETDKIYKDHQERLQQEELELLKEEEKKQGRKLKRL